MEKYMAYSEKVLDHYENPRNVVFLIRTKKGLAQVWLVLLLVVT